MAVAAPAAGSVLLLRRRPTLPPADPDTAWPSLPLVWLALELRRRNAPVARAADLPPTPPAFAVLVLRRPNSPAGTPTLARG
jgi:hypothetical protein